MQHVSWTGYQGDVVCGVEGSVGGGAHVQSRFQTGCWQAATCGMDPKLARGGAGSGLWGPLLEAWILD